MVDLVSQLERIKPSIDAVINEVMSKAQFINGPEVSAFQSEFQEYLGAKHVIPCANGDIAAVLVYPRGFSTNIAIGKIFPVFGSNKNSGLFLHGGIGYLLHYMKIETTDQVVPQIELEYKKGYDRLTTGVNLHQFVGYNFMSNSGSTHFYGGFYAQEGFTKNRRTINFDQPDTPVSTELRLDVQIGFKLGWVIPIYKRQPKDFYFN